VLEFSNVPLVLDQWNVMSMRRTGNISLFYNGLLVNSYTDNAESGSVGHIGRNASWQGEAGAVRK
jgi:hypothetical protein